MTAAGLYSFYRTKPLFFFFQRKKMSAVFTSNALENITTAINENFSSSDYILTTAGPSSDNALNTIPWFYDMGYVIVPVLLAVGLLGNISVIIVMGTSHFRTTTTAVYLIALAVSDTHFILLFPFTKSFTQELFGQDIRALSITGCRAFFCIFRSAKIFSSGLVILIAVERFIVIWFPLRARRILTRKFAVIFVLILLFVVFIFAGLWTLTTSIVDGVCIPNSPTDENKDMSAVFVVAGALVYNVVPSLLLIFLTPLTIFRLLRHRSSRRKMTSDIANRCDETYPITRMLLAIMIAYLILVTPISIAHSVAFFTGENIFESTNKNFIIFREIAQIFEQLNFVLNFFIYVSFNSTFRHHFCKLFCKRKTSMPNVTSRPNLENPIQEDPHTVSSNNDSTYTYNT